MWSYSFHLIFIGLAGSRAFARYGRLFTRCVPLLYF